MSTARRRCVQPMSSISGNGSLCDLFHGHDSLDIVLRWCSAKSLSVLVQVSQGMADAAKPQAKQCLSELCTLWNQLGTPTFRQRVIAARTIHHLGRLCGRRPVVPAKFYLALRDVGHLFKLDMQYDHAATELIFLLFGHLDEATLREPIMNQYPNDASDAWENLIRTVLTYCEHNRRAHATLKFVKEALAFMIGDCEIGCPVAKRRVADLSSEAAVVAMQACTDDDEEQDPTYEPVASSSESDDEDPEAQGWYIDGLWYDCVESFFDDEDFFEDNLSRYPLSHQCTDVRDAYFTSEDPDYFINGDPRWYRYTGPICSNPHCCHEACDCRVSSALYTLTLPEGAAELAIPLPNSEASRYNTYSYPGHGLASADQRAHHRSFDPAANRGLCTSCTAVRNHKGARYAFEAWRRAGQADPWGALAQLGVRVYPGSANGDPFDDL